MEENRNKRSMLRNKNNNLYRSFTYKKIVIKKPRKRSNGEMQNQTTNFEKILGAFQWKFHEAKVEKRGFAKSQLYKMNISYLLN